jgi:three-Cys-motif partner protein
LERFAAQQPNTEIHLFHGAFEDNLTAISDKIDGSFTFIDPTGFKVGFEKIATFLKQQRGEFLSNFMSEFINRFPDQEDVASSYAALLADAEWRARFDELPAELSNEEKILVILQKRLAGMGAAVYLPDFGNSNPKKERLQMRLVFGTSNVHGLKVFRQTQKAIERQEFAQDNQVSLFLGIPLRNPSTNARFCRGHTRCKEPDENTPKAEAGITPKCQK